MKSLNFNDLLMSLVFCISITCLIPSKFIIEGVSRYKFGFPFSFIEIFQDKPNSEWLGNNFFGGNMGMNINPITLFINIIIIYMIIRFVKTRFKRA